VTAVTGCGDRVLQCWRQVNSGSSEESMTKLATVSLVVVALIGTGVIRLQDAPAGSATEAPFWQIQGTAPAAGELASISDLRRTARAGAEELVVAGR
jgi:hypothetical protein